MGGSSPGNINASHPLRVRGLKPESVLDDADYDMSHPLRVRGLKLVGETVIEFRVQRRTPCGCVD